MTPTPKSLLIITAISFLALSCSDDKASPTTTASAITQTDNSDSADKPTADKLYPDVTEAVASKDTNTNSWTFTVTISSPYDTPQRYADAWRVRNEDGTEYGIRELSHDHKDEQPFTRSLSSIQIPSDVTKVIVEGRDQKNGWGGQTKTVTLPK